MAINKAIAYYRVSSKRQGKSGLGLAAQRHAVREFASRSKMKVYAEYKEVESGKVVNRPLLLKALDECKKQNATLLIAKVDRLARNLVFIATLMESNVRFIAIDKPYADEYELHMEAANAQRESRICSMRTKAALQAAKRRGIKLGTSIVRLHKKQRWAYKRFARKMKPLVKRLRRNGFETIRELTIILNEKKVKTFRGGNTRWHLSTVHRLLGQIENL